MKAALIKILKNKAKKTVISAAQNDPQAQKRLIVLLTAAICSLLIPIIVVIFLVFGPIILGQQYIEDSLDEVTTFFDKFGNVLSLKGWCSEQDGSCEKKAEQNYYEKLNDTYKDYKNKNIEIDTNLISATIFYGYKENGYLYDVDENGINQIFVKKYCEANAIGWIGETACELYVKSNYDSIYQENEQTYLKIAASFDDLKERFCLNNKTPLKSLPIKSLNPINASIDKTVEESCEYYLWNYADLDDIKYNPNSMEIIYREGKNDIEKLATEMLSGNRLDYTKYRKYLIETYIPKRFSEVYQNEPDKEYAIEQIADYIMAFASKETKYLANSCSFNEQQQLQVNVDKEYIENIQINTLYPYYHNYYTENASENDIEYTVPLKEYVTGVVYREIHAGINQMSDETIKANLVAIKSYTLGRRSAIEKNGRYYINMRNNTDDQVYCNLDKGCQHYSSYGETNLLSAAPSNVKELLYRLYDETFDDYVYNTSNNKFIGAYTDTKGTCISIGAPTNCMSQTDSITMGNNGNDYKAILSSFYNDNAGILSLSKSTVSTGAYACSQTTYMGGGKYSSNAPRYDNSSDFFSNLNYNYYQSASSMPDPQNIGQCPWYAKGRAIEIMANSNIPDELKIKRIDFLRGMTGNGADWFDNPSGELFSKSTDLYSAKPGAIVSWKGGDVYCSNSAMGLCGHVGIIEDVEYDSSGKATRVLLSDGWNNGSVLSTAAYSYRWMDMESLRRYSTRTTYYFNGYVYLLD